MKKTNKKYHKFIVFGVLILLVLLFVTCENLDEEIPKLSAPSQPSSPSEPSGPSPANSYRVVYNKNAVDATGTMADSIFTYYNEYYYNNKLSINNFVRDNYCFIGWAKTSTSTTVEYTNGQSIHNLTTVGKTIMLYAVWHEVDTVEVTEGSTLADKFIWINNNAESYTTYIIDISTVNTDLDYLDSTLSYGAKKFVTIHLKGTGSIKVRSPLSISSLILDGNLTLSSYYNNYSQVIDIGNSGNFIMNGGTITGKVNVHGTFTMNGGEISNNGRGVGVYVSNGAFTMNGGKISGNNYDYDEGVSVVGTFTMNGGEISNNGRGVYVDGAFIMNGGKISGNTNGGVYVNYGTFTMNGGEISGNTASSGGGVHVWGEYGAFTMNGGEISGNTASSGGGVCVRESGTFTMNGGEIFGNIASGNSSFGGGVYVPYGTFNKRGGTITGSKSENGNVIKDGLGNIVNNKGRAVYVGDGYSYEKRKEITAGPGDNLFYSCDRDENWNYNPTWSGAWDY